MSRRLIALLAGAGLVAAAALVWTSRHDEARGSVVDAAGDRRGLALRMKVSATSGSLIVHTRVENRRSRPSGSSPISAGGSRRSSLHGPASSPEDGGGADRCARLRSTSSPTSDCARIPTASPRGGSTRDPPSRLPANARSDLSSSARAARSTSGGSCRSRPPRQSMRSARPTASYGLRSSRRETVRGLSTSTCS
jgi:hypothetical protein